MILRGHDETWGSLQNENFMGLIKLISEIDPFLCEHLTKCQSKKRNISYLSNTVYEDLIKKMGKRVQKEIAAQINNSDTKYFSIIIDSTPDLSHVDQLAVIVRYVYNGQPYERLLTFIPNINHTAQSLFNTIKKFLTDISLPKENIRGQSYDNAANMSPKYSGLQARLKEINKNADFVPCAVHSLNLVGVEAVSIVTPNIDYFGILQRLYVFFSASPRRWDFLKKYANLQFSLKSLSITRWSMYHDSVKALKNGCRDILKTLNYIHEESEEKLDCKREANILFKKLIKLENAILTIFWEEVLERFNKVSHILQTPGLDVSKGYELIFSLELFVNEMRKNSEEKMNEFKKKAKNLSEENTGNYNDLNIY
ncbi:uncharacterized protein LOC136086059 [Hydra vulgaris]|uniref:Uncharacterized protein LOC136086059 n=1 Tax=Hydra vulgaris TaxID=6087 RepID=A0ABM4CRA6_HYDVU